MSASIVQFKQTSTAGGGATDVVLDQPGTEGNIFVVWVTLRSSTLQTAVSGWTVHPSGICSPGSDVGRMSWRVIGPGESATIRVTNASPADAGCDVSIWELSGVSATPTATSEADVDTNTMPTTIGAGSISPSSAGIIILGALAHSTDSGGQVNFVTAGSGFTEDAQPWDGAHPLMYAAHRIIGAGGTYSTDQGFSGFTANFGGWGGQAAAFGVAAEAPDPGTDVEVRDPEGVSLVGLDDAFGKKFRAVLHGTGEFEFKINKSSPNATETNLARDNVVAFTVPQISPNAIWAGFLEVGDFDLISKDEAGGETLRFGGRGILAYLERDVAWTTSYVLVTSPTDGYWRFAPVGTPGWSTGNEPGQILKRIIDEMQHASRPQHCMDLLDDSSFDYATDSDGNAWATTDATDPVWTVPVGENVLETTGRLVGTGVLEVQIDPDFNLGAYNHFGRDLTGDDFGPGVVRFVHGVNIADKVSRQWNGADIAAYELVAGDDGHYIRAELPDAATRVQKVVFNQFAGTNNPTLEALGLADLENRLVHSESALFAVAIRRIGGTETADEGRYLPGPEGTSGDFWVGDTVRLVTGTTPLDYVETDVRVSAITIAEEVDEEGSPNLSVLVELGSTTGVLEETYAGGGTGGVAAPGGIVGVTSHGALGGRAVEGQHPADAVSYDPTTSELVGTDVQTAIDELAATRAQVHLAASSDPTATDDAGDGWREGARWINFATGEEFVLVDSTAGAAVWTSTTGGGGSGGGSLELAGDTGSASTIDDITFIGTGGIAVDVNDLTGGAAEVTIDGSGVSGGSGAGLLWPLDDNTLHATYGDDFDGTGLDAKWTRHNVTSGAETYQAGGDGSWLDVAVPSPTVDQSYFQTAPAGDFEVQFKQALHSASTHMYGPMIIDSSGAGVGLTPYDNGNVVFMALLSAYQYSSSGGNDNLLTFGYQRGEVLWLAIRKVGTVYTFRWSRNGQIWTPYATGVTNGFTVNRIGWGRFFGTAAGHHIMAGRFNVV